MSIKILKSGPQKLLIIGPDPFISQSSPEHSPELIFHIMKSLIYGPKPSNCQPGDHSCPQCPPKKKVNHICHWPPTKTKFDFKPNFKSRIKRLFTLQTTPVVAPKERVWRCVLQHGNHLSFQVVATVSVAS